MAKKTRATISVVSDLHCQLDTPPVGSFLTVASLRSPVSHHPIQSLVELIKHDKTRANVLVVPGDLADKSSQEGMNQAWEYALELGRELKVRTVVPVLGNHDIDWKGVKGNNPFKIPKELHPEFPFRKRAASASFFTDGFCFQTVKPGVEILVINTVVDYLNSASATRGSFAEEHIERLARALQTRQTVPIRVAVMHHHPVLHSSPFLVDSDVLETGDHLLSVLREYGCGLVIHGHKHHPRLTIADTDYGSIPVLAAGSFSKILGRVSSVTKNVVHHLELESNTSTAFPLRGQIFTREWRLGTGWVPASSQSADFPYVTGFGGDSTPDDLKQSLLNLINSRPEEFSFGEDELLKVAPSLAFLTPSQFKDFARELLEKERLEISQDRNGQLTLGKLYAARRGTKK